MENPKAFKNWINPSVVKKIGDSFKKAFSVFDEKRFFEIVHELSQLELKPRVLLVTQALRKEFSKDFVKDSKIILKVLKSKELKGFELWPISEYIAQFGLNHFNESFELMYLLTQDFTSEFAIRPFIQQSPDKVLNKLQQWIDDKNVHVRRWISEGTRPILPWGGKIESFIQSPVTIPLIEHLKYDEELYVRKSVANHLNDITKHHPELVMKTLSAWKKNSPQDQLHKIEWIIRHSLRTLIKKGDKNALALLGVSKELKIKVLSLKINKKEFKLGEVLEFQFNIYSKSSKQQKLIIDYGIDFKKSNGSLSTKIFKLKTIHLKSKEKILISKKHPLKKITTMKFYPGQQRLIVQINGEVLLKKVWNLKG